MRCVLLLGHVTNDVKYQADPDTYGRPVLSEHEDTPPDPDLPNFLARLRRTSQGLLPPVVVNVVVDDDAWVFFNLFF